MKSLTRPTLLFLTTLLAACLCYGQAQEMDDALTRAQAEQTAGEYAKAAADYAEATSLNPKIPELWANRGLMEYLSDDQEHAIASLKHSLLLNPTLFTSILFLGKAYVDSGRPEAAMAYLKHANMLRPEDVETLLSLGKAEEALHQPRSAAGYFSRAAEIAPDKPGAWFGMGVASLAVIDMDGRDLATSGTQSVWAHALYGDELFAQGRPVEAITTYKTAIRAASPTQLATLAQTVQQMRSHPEIFSFPPASRQPLQDVAQQIAVDPNKASTPSCPAADARHSAHASITLDGLLRGAACAYWAGDDVRSVSFSEQALRLSTHNPEALYWSIKANERRAVASLSQFEALAPRSPATYDMVGDLYRHQRQPGSAMSEYAKALAIDPRDPAAQLGSAAVQLSEGHADQAASLAHAALADRPQDTSLNLIMAEALVSEHQYQEAEPYLGKCLTVSSDQMPYVHGLIGRVDAAEGKTAEAIEQLELSLSSDRDGSLHYQLARLYRKTGKVEQAQKAESEAQALANQRLANAEIAVRETTAPNL